MKKTEGLQLRGEAHITIILTDREKHIHYYNTDRQGETYTLL